MSLTQARRIIWPRPGEVVIESFACPAPADQRYFSLAPGHESLHPSSAENITQSWFPAGLACRLKKGCRPPAEATAPCFWGTRSPGPHQALSQALTRP